MFLFLQNETRNKSYSSKRRAVPKPVDNDDGEIFLFAIHKSILLFIITKEIKCNA